MKTKMALYDEDFKGIVVETENGHRQAFVKRKIN